MTSYLMDSLNMAVLQRTWRLRMWRWALRDLINTTLLRSRALDVLALEIPQSYPCSSNHQINYNCFNGPFAVSPFDCLYWDMHGLIFETSIWLLAIEDISGNVRWKMVLGRPSLGLSAFPRCNRGRWKFRLEPHTCSVSRCLKTLKLKYAIANRI